MDTTRNPPRVVVLGGGFGGLEALFDLRRRLGRTVDLTLVSDRPEFRFKPNTIYIPFGKEPERFVFPLAHALEKRRVTFRQALVQGVDPGAKKVSTSAGDVPYDHLIIATGATMRPQEVPGLQEHGNTIWTPEEMMRLRGALEKMVERARAGTKQRVLFLVPPNNRCAGPLYEMVFMLDTWLRHKNVRPATEIAHSTYEATFIQAFGPRLHEVVTREFAERGIDGHTGEIATSVEPGRVRYRDGSTREFDLLVSFPPYAAAVRYDALPSDERGFVTTDRATRQVAGHPDIYAVGDGGDFPVKQAFLALLQADTAAAHLASRIQGEVPEATFDPVSMCIMEQFDKATFAQVPLRFTDDPARPVEVRTEATELYKVGTGPIWRIGKKMLGTVMPARFTAGKPFHAGPSWSAMEAGLKVMSAALAD